MNDPYYMHQTNAMKKRRMNFLIRLFSAFYLLHRYALTSNSHRYHRSPKYKRRASHKQLEAFQS